MVQRRTNPTAAPVAKSWQRIEAWLDEYLPAIKATLRPGITKRDLAKFEKAIGQPLPDDVRESWRIHDGQGLLPKSFTKGFHDPIPESLGLFFGQWHLNPLSELKWRSVLVEWNRWNKMLNEYADMFAGFDKNSVSFPRDAIQRRHFLPGWVPLVTFIDADFLAVDLAPGSKGVVGQVINFGRNDDNKYVLASSWSQYLEDFADELEAGNFVIDFDIRCGEFSMKRPRPHNELPYYNEYKAWSIAKYGPTIRNAIAARAKRARRRS